MAYVSYQAYLCSPEWAIKRAQYWAIFGRTCKVCGSTEHLQVDHLDYSNLGNERVTVDLLGLCSVHHKAITRERRRRGALTPADMRRVTEEFFGIDLVALSKDYLKKSSREREPGEVVRTSRIKSREVPCPECGAASGDLCHGLKRGRRVSSHAARHELWVARESRLASQEAHHGG